MLRRRAGSSSRAATTAARLSAAAAIGYLVVGLVAQLATPAADRAELFASPEPTVGPAMAVVGAVLLGRGNRVVQLTTLIGCSACVYAGSVGLAAHGFAGSDDPALVFRVAAWLTLWTWVPSFLSFALLLPLFFPDGRLLSRRWRPVAAMAVALIVVTSLLTAFTDIQPEGGQPPNPVALTLPEAVLDVVEAVLDPLLPALALLASASLVLRFRRADPQGRRQIAWVGYALAVAVLASFVAPPPLNVVATLAVPVAIGIAVVRYRLFGIDVVLNRTLVGTALLACSALVYVAVVGWLGGLAGTADTVVGLVGAVAVAAVFHPLYVRIQRAVDRLLHGLRGDPHRVIAHVTQVLRDAASPRRALAEAVATIAADLKLPAVSVRVDRPDALPVVESVGEPALAVHSFPLRWHDDVVGALHVARRVGTDALDPLDVALLGDLADQLAAVGFALRLATDLERSHDRLVSAREEERRRIRRDLHDGLGPQLASAVMALDVATRALAQEPGRAAPLVTTARGQLQEAVGDVRRIVHGLRPPALDDLGLVGALQATGPGLLADQAGAPDIRIEGSGELASLPAAVEVAAFRIAQEAMTNAIRHAGAKRITVHLDAGPDGVGIEVDDDGRGCPDDAVPGLGLQSMRDRAAELGGSCRISCGPGGGTRVSALLPLRVGGPG
ncbi:Histidine kinase-, DNA gyrase B-, and HSP90-like ATPase [Blastococcus aurantiacus]|uniref:histidine kinase n=1 Tax=Blastococcus aurantiacus TaxID=1550231 RepID=A0A1G7I1G6_9ACTN|nr:GAF domain-containing sensor histidine kinase [Blastococcus aurantiacus]SDF06413.1 Histidine kinase-, DNA gyrase B-, and HSP90-like ATPase [Blastococcus aurantiacus]